MTAEEHQNRVLGGYKATLSNPNVVSAEVKEHAREVLRECGQPVPVAKGNQTYVPPTAEAQQHQQHVLGGYKSTLANPNTSDQAKAHARQMLEQAGETTGLPAPHDTHHPGHEHDTRAHDEPVDHHDHSQTKKKQAEHERRVLGGYKATINNPRASDEAKEQAREFLRQHGESV